MGICEDDMYRPIYIYNLPVSCYSIGVEREQAPNERNLTMTTKNTNSTTATFENMPELEVAPHSPSTTSRLTKKTARRARTTSD